MAALSKDGNLVAASYRDEPVILTDVADPAQPSKVRTIDHKLEYPGAMEFSPDGNTLFITGDRVVQLWDLTDAAATAPIASIPKSWSPLAVSPDGKTLAAVGAQGGNMWKTGVNLWNITDRAQPALLAETRAQGNSIVSSEFSPDGKTLATGSHDRIATLWDVTELGSPRKVATLTGNHWRVGALAFSRDGKTLATGDNGWARVWDIAEPSQPLQLATVKVDQHHEPGPMAFSADGNTLAVGTRFGRDAMHLGIWDLKKLNGLRADPASFGCRITGRGLNADEWRRYASELDYQRTCG
jgi:WD40 repeat protein